MTAARDKKGVFEGLKQFLEFLSLLGVIGGGAFAAWQYVQTQELTRVNRTMDYIKSYDEGPVGDARRSLKVFLFPILDQMDHGGVKSETREQWLGDMPDHINDAQDPAAVEANIDAVVAFYESLQTCVDNNLCSAKVADKYFYAYDANEFWHNFGPYIIQKCASSPYYGSSLRRHQTNPLEKAPKECLIAQ